MTFELIAGVVLLAVGALVILASLAPSAPSAGTPTFAQRSAHAQLQLGLAHRLVARLVMSPVRPADAAFAVAGAMCVDAGQLLGGRGAHYLELGEPLLELENLIERLERLNNRVRNIASRGRRRVRS